MFNLVRDPWIPVFCGKSKLVSLNELFEQLPKIAAFEGTSIEKISLIRLIICITQAALKGPKTEKQYKECKKDIVSGALAYLKKWEHKFDLYGKNAFLQMPWLPELKNKSMDYLRLLYPSGDNHTLFNHEASKESRVLDDSELALSLLVTQEFGVGGLVKIPEFKWLGKKIPPLTSAKATGINNILLTVIIGKNLLDTVHNNLIPIEWLDESKTMAFGRPVWEYGAIEKDKDEYHEIQGSYLGSLVPLSRGIVLYSGEIKITLVEGIPSIGFPAYREPMAALRTLKISEKKKPKKKETDSPYLRCSLNKAGWRELESILSLPQVTGINHKEAWAFRHFRDCMETHPEITVMVAGFASFQARKDAVLEWVVVLPKGFMASISKYKTFVEKTEECYKKLGSALWRCINAERTNSKPGDKDNTLSMMRARSSSEYWPKMEVLALKAIEAINEDRDWESEILKEARVIYNRTCPDVSMMSKVKGLQLLY